MRLIIELLIVVMLLVFVCIVDWQIVQWKRTRTTYTKQKFMIKNWMNKDLSKHVIDWCKKDESRNAKWCVELYTHLRIHEGSRWKSSRCKANNNCNWLYKWLKKYQNKKESFDDWYWRYKKYWYKSNCKDMVYKSHYTLTQKKEWIKNCYVTFYNLNK